MHTEIPKVFGKRGPGPGKYYKSLGKLRILIYYLTYEIINSEILLLYTMTNYLGYIIKKDE